MLLIPPGLKISFDAGMKEAEKNPNKKTSRMNAIDLLIKNKKKLKSS